MNTIIDLVMELDSVTAVERISGIAQGNDFEVTVKACDEGFGFDEATVVSLAISFALGSASGIVANAIYDAVGSAIKSITINNRRIRPNKEALEQAIEIIRRSAEEDS